MAILDGIKVLDFSQGMSGSLATMILADNGAQVTKVEPPGGDPWRFEATWIMWNRSKRGVVLDLGTEQGREQAKRLARGADVVVENFVTGTTDRLGIGYDALSANNPSLVYCSITAVGSKGRYAGLKPYEGLACAAAGDYKGQLMGPTKKEGPIYRARPNGNWGAANFAVQGIVSALRVRNRTGAGQQVETSMYQGLQTYDSMSAMARQVELGLIDLDMKEANSRRTGPGGDINLPYLVARCKDGQWIQITCLAARLFPNWMKAIGLGDIYEDERFRGAPFVFGTREDKAELRRMIYEAMLTRTIDEWIAIFAANDVGGDAFITTQQAMDHPQTRHNGGVIEVDDTAFGPTKQIAPLVKLTETASQVRGGAPLLGQHTEQALAEVASVAMNGAAPAAPPSASGGPRHPLEGMVILDFASWLAAPVGTALIADLGARVIKIEPPSGDEFRSSTQGRGRTFQGKESLVLDLKTAEARQVMEKLISRADAIMHNMRGEAPNRLGIDYETVRKINPNIVYLYAGSYGSTGPGAGRAAFHPIGGALSGGALWQLGAGNEPPPNDTPMTINEITEKSVEMFVANEGSPDVTAAIGVATALALALYEKDRTGKGQYVETTMLLSNCYICSDDFIRYEGKPERLPIDRNQKGTHALNRMYRTKDGWLFVACPLQEEWEALCHALGKEEWLDDPRFTTRDDRLRHSDKLIAALALALTERTADEWEDQLWLKNVPVARADRTVTADFMLTGDVAKENGFVVETNRPTLGRMYRQGPPVRFSLTPARAEPAYAFGENTEAILAEIGISAEEIARLVEAGIAITPHAAPA